MVSRDFNRLEGGRATLLPDDFHPQQSAPMVSPHTQAMLFHALGGSTDWFQRAVIPHLRYWAAQLKGIGIDYSCDPAQIDKQNLEECRSIALRRRELDFPKLNPMEFNSVESNVRPAIDALIENGLADLSRGNIGAEWSIHTQARGISPASQLMRLHQTMMDSIWCLLQNVEIESGQGTVWRLGEEILQSWWEKHRHTQAQLRLINTIHQDIWNQAIEYLLDQAIWGKGQAGRWLVSPSGCFLLWPLAGRDLQHTLKELGYPEYSIETVRRNLKQWGYTNSNCVSSAVFPWVRDSDQKTFFGLRATPRLIHLIEGPKTYLHGGSLNRVSQVA